MLAQQIGVTQVATPLLDQVHRDPPPRKTLTGACLARAQGIPVGSGERCVVAMPRARAAIRTSSR